MSEQISPVPSEKPYPKTHDHLLFGVGLKLVPWKSEDAPSVFESILESPNALPWLPWAQDYTLEKAEKYVHDSSYHRMKKYTYYGFAIKSLDTSERLLGSIDLKVEKDTQKASIGYWIRKNEQRKGFAKKAIHLIRQFAFEKLNLEELEIVVWDGNYPSQKVAQSAEFKLSHYIPNHTTIEDVHHAAWVYQDKKIHPKV